MGNAVLTWFGCWLFAMIAVWAFHTYHGPIAEAAAPSRYGFTCEGDGNFERCENNEVVCYRIIGTPAFSCVKRVQVCV